MSQVEYLNIPETNEKLANNDTLKNLELINSILRLGDKGSEKEKQVKALQSILIDYKFLNPTYKDRKGNEIPSEDGDFGGGTKKALKKLQSLLINKGFLKPYYINRKGEKVSNIDGIFGGGTKKALREFVIKENQRVRVTYELEKSEEKLNNQKKEIKDIYNKASVRKQKEINKIANNQENEKLEAEQKKNREGFNNQIDAKVEQAFVLKDFTFAYENDNGIGLNGEEFGDDTGKTFSFDLKGKAGIFGSDYLYNAEATHYTSGEKFKYNPDGSRNWEETDTSNAKRVDYIHIDLQKNVYNKVGDDYRIDGYFGGGVDINGTEILGDIQKDYHKKMGYYDHNGKYEDFTGISPTINGTLELKKILSGDKNAGVYVNGVLEGQVPLVQKYGKLDLSGEIGIGGNYGDASIEVSYKKGYRELPRGSETMANTGLNGDYNQTSISGAVPIPFTENSKAGLKYTNGEQEYLGVEFMYKFDYK